MVVPWDKVFEVLLLLGQGFGIYLIRRNKDATAKNREVIRGVESEVCRLNQTINNTTNCNFRCPMESAENVTFKSDASQTRDDDKRFNFNHPNHPV